MMRKIIQIVASQVSEGALTQCEMYLHALCDDGTLWRISNRDIDVNGFWAAIPPIPQDEPPAPELQTAPRPSLTHYWTADVGATEATKILSEAQLLDCDPSRIAYASKGRDAVSLINRWAAGDRDLMELQCVQVDGRDVELICDLLPF